MKIEEVAAKCGVSVMTVSRVSNNSNLVSAKTREKVLKMIEELDYRPNHLARGLITKRTKTIGVLAGDMENPVYLKAINGISDYMSEHDYDVIISNSSDFSRAVKSVNTLLCKQVDSLILLPIEFLKTHDNNLNRNIDIDEINRFYDWLTDKVETMNKENHSIAMLGYDLYSDMASKVFFNYYGGALIAVDYLISLGHKKIGCLYHKNSSSGLWLERYNGFKDSLAKGKIEENIKFNAECDESFTDSYEAMTSILKRGDIPTAMYCFNDLMAIGAIHAIQDFGLNVPNDISVIGHDGVYPEEFSRPRLTTVSISAYDAGIMLAKSVIDTLDNDVKPHNYYIEPKLIVRNSTKKIN